MVMASKASIFGWFFRSPSVPDPTAPAPFPMTDPDLAPADPHPMAEDPLLQGLRCLDLKGGDEGDSNKVEFEVGKGGGGGKEKEKEKEKVEDEGDEVERDEGEGLRSVRYPVRPGVEDCSYYMRTGNCKFGSDCKFNHPVVRKNQDKLKEKEKEESRDRASGTECKVIVSIFSPMS